jgi:ElaB/YqjD/DUF883 family membrane-anchored ribosome-binding protein
VNQDIREVANMTEETMDTAEAVLEKGEGQLKKFFDDVEDLIRRVTPNKDEAVSRVRNRLESSIHSARRTTERGMRQAIDASSSAARAADGYAHRSPWAVIGITAAVGLVIGSLLVRRR